MAFRANLRVIRTYRTRFPVSTSLYMKKPVIVLLDIFQSTPLFSYDNTTSNSPVVFLGAGNPNRVRAVYSFK